MALNLGPADRGAVFTIIENDGTDPVVRANGGGFAFAGNFLEEGEVFTADGQEFAFTYAGGSGNDVVLVALPEPTAAMLLVAASVFCHLRRQGYRAQHGA